MNGPSTSGHLPSAKVRFGPFELDLDTGELRKHGYRLRLQEQPFRVLACLVAHAGEIVSREALCQSVWSNEYFVDFEHGLNYCVNQIRSVLDDDPKKPRFIETLSKRGYRFIGELEDAASVAPVSVASEKLRIRIAVLPFRDLSQDGSQEYLAQGISDGVISELAQLKSVRIIARTSVQKFKSRHFYSPKVAEALGVDLIVEGSIIEGNGVLQVTATLVNARTGEYIWAERNECDPRNSLAIVSSVAGKIMHATQGTAAVDGAARVRRAVHVPAVAQDAYFRGRFLCNRGREQNLIHGIEYLKKAISVFPEFAAAHAALAEACCSLYLSDPGKMTLVEVREAAERSLKVDSSLPEAHIAIGVVRIFGDWDWPGAYEAFTRARDFQPNNPKALHWLVGWYAVFGRVEEATNCLQLSLEGDPLSISSLSRSTYALVLQQRYDEAEQRLRFALELDPHLSGVASLLAYVYSKAGRKQEAEELAQKAVHDLSDSDPERLFELAYIALLNGSAELGRDVLLQLSPAEFENLSSGKRAFMLAAAGAYEEALDQLESAIKNHDPHALPLLSQPLCDPLKTYPRYQDLRRQVGLPPLL